MRLQIKLGYIYIYPFRLKNTIYGTSDFFRYKLNTPYFCRIYSKVEHGDKPAIIRKKALVGKDLGL
jgi:hypothetical protein